MKAVCLHDKNEIEAFLRGDMFLHIYSIGDLDDSFWPYTTWYPLRDPTGIRAIALMYTGEGLPILPALTGDEKAIFMQELLRSLARMPPKRFNAHGEHYKMALTKRVSPRRERN